MPILFQPYKANANPNDKHIIQTFIASVIAISILNELKRNLII